MHKAAYNGQPGTKRDVSLALTAALADVSHALRLDRPRALVQDAMGRQNADTINVAIVVPPSTTTDHDDDPEHDADEEAHDEAGRPEDADEARLHAEEEAAGSGSPETRS